MKTEIEAAVKALAKKAQDSKSPHETMQLAQAVLSMVHALKLLKESV